MDVTLSDFFSEGRGGGGVGLYTGCLRTCEPDFLQGRFDSLVVKRATSQFNPFCIIVAKQNARFWLPILPYFEVTLVTARGLSK